VLGHRTAGPAGGAAELAGGRRRNWL